MTVAKTKPSILEQTLSAARRDTQTTTPEGKRVGRLTHGVSIRPLTVHADARGSVCEIIDMRWGWHAEPILSAYVFTIRPGIVKGWNLHKEHEDRYAILKGELELVFFDPRPDSPTCGEICKIGLSDQQRCLVNVPANVWHADHNIGSSEVVVINFPTQPYDHANPDKYRLPIGTDLIPYSFGSATGW